jgi:ubiquinone/menaquinone biosynthesis C-methylase UbiE
MLDWSSVRRTGNLRCTGRIRNQEAIAMQVHARSNHARGQVRASAAEIYDEFFVPALFEAWAPRLLDAAGVRHGFRVLDVACGTGVVARAAVGRIGAGSVTGLDANSGMLAVARRHHGGIEWRDGRAEALPFDDTSFDTVLCQFGLMFFDERAAALREMRRVLRSGGRLAIAVWDSLERTPGYAAMTALLRRLFGEEIAAALRAPYCLGDTRELAALLEQAGIGGAQIATVEGVARFPSIASWVRTDIKGWTLADRIDDAQFARLAAEAEKELRHFVTADGSVEFAHPAHIATATKE